MHKFKCSVKWQRSFLYNLNVAFKVHLCWFFDVCFIFSVVYQYCCITRLVLKVTFRTTKLCTKGSVRTFQVTNLLHALKVVSGIPDLTFITL